MGVTCVMPLSNRSLSNVKKPKSKLHIIVGGDKKPRQLFIPGAVKFDRCQLPKPKTQKI